MYASELMIGDWVINPVHDDKARIEGVYFDKELRCLVATDGRFPQMFFDPIPLTAEILEKNGFVDCPHFGEIYVAYDYELESYIFYSENVWSRASIAVSDVHELQHALRLCRLNELADNLKVE